MRVRRISGQKGVSRVCRGFIKKSSKLLKYNNLEDYVWMTGLEPATSWSLTRCATNCATSRYDSLWGCKDKDYFPIIKGIFVIINVSSPFGFCICRIYIVPQLLCCRFSGGSCCVTVASVSFVSLLFGLRTTGSCKTSAASRCSEVHRLAEKTAKTVISMHLFLL